MSRNRLPVARHVIIGGLLFALVTTLAAAQEESDSPYSLADFSGIKNPTKENKLPDLGSPAVRKQLGCSVCRAVVGDIRDQFMGLLKKKDQPEKAKRRRLSELDIATVTDGFCERLSKEFNLVALDNIPDFAEKDRRYDKGYWVSQFFELRCSELLDAREDEMVKHFQEHPDQFLQRICNECTWKTKDWDAAAEAKKQEAASQQQADAPTPAATGDL